MDAGFFDLRWDWRTSTTETGFLPNLSAATRLFVKNPVSRLHASNGQKNISKKGLTNLGEFGNVINVERKRCSASNLTQTQDSKFSKLSWCL